MPRFWSYLKEVSFGSQKPLFQRLFADPQSTFGDAGIIAELTKRVNADPSFILPPGFIKVRANKISQKYRAPKFVSES